MHVFSNFALSLCFFLVAPFFCWTFAKLHSFYVTHFHLVLFSRFTIFRLPFFNVTLSSCCALSMYNFRIALFNALLFLSLFVFSSCCTFFILHFFRVALFQYIATSFSFHVFSMFHFLHSFSCCIHFPLFLCCTYFVWAFFKLHFFHVPIFYVALFLCYIFFMFLFSVLHYFHVFFVWLSFHVESFSCCKLFMLHYLKWFFLEQFLCRKRGGDCLFFVCYMKHVI